ncbi:MAG: hypothetical protein ACR2QL_05020 [Woeseiaceae bacterium]
MTRRLLKTQRSTSINLLIALAMLPLLAGCIAVPIPDLPETHVQYLDNKPRSRIEVGKTSRDDVLDNLGSPTALSANPSIWMYSIKEYTSTGWEFCFALMIHQYMPIECLPKIEGEETLSFLEIRFDDSRTVTQKRVVKLALDECTDTGFCWDGYLSFNPSGPTKPWHCAVHLFTNHAAISTKIDTARSKEYELSLTANDFQIFLLQPWEPEVIFAFDDGSKKRVTVPCDRKSAHFVFVFKKAAAFDVKVIPEHKARPLIVGKQTLTRVNFD